MKDVYCLQAELPTANVGPYKFYKIGEQAWTVEYFVFTIYNHFNILYLQARKTLRYVLHPSDLLESMD